MRKGVLYALAAVNAVAEGVSAFGPESDSTQPTCQPTSTTTMVNGTAVTTTKSCGDVDWTVLGPIIAGVVMLGAAVTVCAWKGLCCFRSCSSTSAVAVERQKLTKDAEKGQAGYSSTASAVPAPTTSG